MQENQSSNNYVAMDISTVKPSVQQDAQISSKQNNNKRKPKSRNKNFVDIQIRTQFVLKMFICLSMELMFTFLLVVLGLYTNMQYWLVITGQNEICYCAYGNQTHCGCTFISRFTPTWLFYLSITVSLILHIVLFCGGQRIRKAPLNLIILGLYLIFFGFLITNLCIVLAYGLGVGIVWQAMGMTLVFVFGLTVYTFKSQSIFSYRIGSICIFIPTLIVMPILMGMYWSYALSIFLCMLFIIGQGFFLVWETKTIIGDGKLNLSINDYALGSLLLYASIIQLIWRILMWVDSIRSRKAGQELANEYIRHKLKQKRQKDEQE